MLTADQHRAAGLVLWLAVAGRLDEAMATLNKLGQDHPDAIPTVMIGWIDTALDRAGVTEYGPGKRLGVALESDPNGPIKTVAELEDAHRWAARLVTARLTDDEGAFRALLETRATDQAWSAGVAAVLRIAAGTIRAAQKGLLVGAVVTTRAVRHAD